MDTPSQATLQRQWGCSTSRAIPSGRAGAGTTSLRLGLPVGLGVELGLGSGLMQVRFRARS